MQLDFIKVNPAGNVTVYILDPLPRHLHGAVAQKLLNPCHLGGDQVGFLEPPAAPAGQALARLQMMGGEFCGNASRGLAAVLLERGFPGLAEAGGLYNTPLEVSGYDGIVQAAARPISGHRYWAECLLPVPLSVRPLCVDIGGRLIDAALVDFPGITHVVAPGLAPGKDALNTIRAQVPGVADLAALGVMFYDPKARQLTPVVYVRDAGTLVWEGSCGSGSVAVAAAQALASGGDVMDLTLNQPGGSLQVDIQVSAGRVTLARIKGEVDIVASGTVYLDLD